MREESLQSFPSMGPGRRPNEADGRLLGPQLLQHLLRALVRGIQLQRLLIATDGLLLVPALHVGLALNTWENETGAEREALVRKFMEEKKYTFRVLFDDNAVYKYGVDGIPTKFIIDKKGMIRFKSVGFEGSKMLDEMTVEIEMLLDDGFYASVK